MPSRLAQLLVLIVATLATAVRADEPVPSAMLDVGVSEKPDAQLPMDLPFTDEMGRTVTLRECMLAGKPMVLQLGYFGCPMLCDLVSKGMLKSMEDLDLNIGRDFTVVNLSFDQRETRNEAFLKKKTYLQHYSREKAGEGWHFLIGDKEAVRKVTDAVGFKYKWISDTQQFSHPAVLMIVTPEGRVSRYLYGVEFPKRTLQLSLVEASQGKIGTAMDQVIMLCFQYDSSIGKYTFAAIGLMRTGGVLTVMVLATVIGRMLLKERRAERGAFETT